MARTTETAVKRLIVVDTTVAADLSPFIETASAMVDSCCLGFDPAYSAVHLELIERWLAAHYYAVLDPRKDSEKADVVGDKNQYKVDLGFNVTTYGQQALRLDFKGGLASVEAGAKDGNLGKKVSITWMGTEL